MNAQDYQAPESVSQAGKEVSCWTRLFMAITLEPAQSGADRESS